MELVLSPGQFLHRHLVNRRQIRGRAHREGGERREIGFARCGTATHWGNLSEKNQLTPSNFLGAAILFLVFPVYGLHSCTPSLRKPRQVAEELLCRLSVEKQ